MFSGGAMSSTMSKAGAGSERINILENLQLVKPNPPPPMSASQELDMVIEAAIASICNIPNDSVAPSMTPPPAGVLTKPLEMRPTLLPLKRRAPSKKLSPFRLKRVRGDSSDEECIVISDSPHPNDVVNRGEIIPPKVEPTSSVKTGLPHRGKDMATLAKMVVEDGECGHEDDQEDSPWRIVADTKRRFKKLEQKNQSVRVSVVNELNSVTNEVDRVKGEIERMNLELRKLEKRQTSLMCKIKDLDISDRLISNIIDKHNL